MFEKSKFCLLAAILAGMSSSTVSGAQGNSVTANSVYTSNAANKDSEGNNNEAVFLAENTDNEKDSPANQDEINTESKASTRDFLVHVIKGADTQTLLTIISMLAAGGIVSKDIYEKFVKSDDVKQALKDLSNSLEEEPVAEGSSKALKIYAGVISIVAVLSFVALFMVNRWRDFWRVKFLSGNIPREQVKDCIFAATRALFVPYRLCKDYKCEYNQEVVSSEGENVKPENSEHYSVKGSFLANVIYPFCYFVASDKAEVYSDDTIVIRKKEVKDKDKVFLAVEGDLPILKTGEKIYPIAFRENLRLNNDEEQVDWGQFENYFKVTLPSLYSMIYNSDFDVSKKDKVVSSLGKYFPNYDTNKSETATDIMLLDYTTGDLACPFTWNISHMNTKLLYKFLLVPLQYINEIDEKYKEGFCEFMNLLLKDKNTVKKFVAAGVNRMKAFEPFFNSQGEGENKKWTFKIPENYYKKAN